MECQETGGPPIRAPLSCDGRMSNSHPRTRNTGQDFGFVCMPVWVLSHLAVSIISAASSQMNEKPNHFLGESVLSAAGAVPTKCCFILGTKGNSSQDPGPGLNRGSSTIDGPSLRGTPADSRLRWEGSRVLGFVVIFL